MVGWIGPVAALCLALIICSAQSHSDASGFVFSNGPMPNPFQRDQHYPYRSEEVECRRIRTRIERNSRRYRTDLVTNEHSSVHFADADARIMSNRLHRRLNELADLFHAEYSVWIRVTKAWTEFGDEEVSDPASLHFEGRTVRVSVDVHLISPLLRLAVEIGFDWVLYAADDYVRMSVIPDLCDVSLDMVFMLDRSGSVGAENFDTAIDFLQSVVSFFTVASNATQVGLVTYATDATIEFDLNDFQSVEGVIAALRDVIYTKGWTATALALFLTRVMLDPGREYGARPFSDGVPKVAVLLTDGRSNQISIIDRANNLRKFGVQVFTVGIGDINLPELQFIASDPDQKHVFLLHSFNEAERFVDMLSFTTCDAPAVVEPGEDTTTEIEEDEFRFFQSRCAAFSQTIMIEQIDLVGKCSLYASSIVQNPGPLDPPDSVVRNENQTSNSRSVLLNLPYTQDNRFVYVSVLGKRSRNEFTLVIWDRIFQQDEYTIGYDATRQQIINLVEKIRTTDAMFSFSITNGNEEGLFALDPLTGILTTTQPLSTDTHTFRLNIVAQNREHACHRSRVVVIVEVEEENLVFDPLPQPVSLNESTMTGVLVTQISANTFGVTYAIIDGNTGNAFSIDPETGNITVVGPLDFETTPEYSLTVRASDAATSSTIMALQLITIEDVNETPFFVTECALNGSCMFSVPENEAPPVVVRTVQADDPDSSLNPNGVLNYALVPSTVPFEVSGTGTIRTTEPLDFEAVPSHSFMLVVRDGGSPPLSVQIPVRVEVINIEENQVPIFAAPCEVDVEENIPIGLPFLQCSASDSDEQGNPILGLVYEVTDGNINNTFRYDPAAGPGIIVATRNLDREERDEYLLTVTATDAGGLSGNTTATIRITDLNDNAPVCMPPMDPVVISSNMLPQAPERTVTVFTSTDADLEVIPPEFSLESKVMNSMDTSAVVTVRVTDGADAALSSTCMLTVQFEESCFIQDYDIDQSAGRLSAKLLCSVAIEPDVIEIAEGTNGRILCPIVRNVPVSYLILHNGTDISTAIPLADSEESGSSIFFNVNFDDSGVYVCQAISSDLGTISSPSAILNVLVAPEIIMPPINAFVGVGEMVEFQCSVSGIPDPTISWFRASQQIVLGEDPRFTPQGDTLRITDIQSVDMGEYRCVASNTAGSASASADLTITSMQQIVIANVPEYFMPSLDSSCHEFNTTDFNSVLTDITSYSTITTDQVSNDLCPPSPCNPSPCENRGVCMNDSTAVGWYTCQCPPQYIGKNCEMVTDPCIRTPCLNDGLCASTSRGDFVCTCPDGYHGDRCQYTDVCSSSAPCGVDTMCLETVVMREGYVCVDVEGGGGAGVTVTVGSMGHGGAGTVTSTLNGEVNSYIETADIVGRRKRRATSEDGKDSMADNGFVTVCEARFIPSPTTPDTLLLVWACPDGVTAPDATDEEAICELLIAQRLVASCTSRRGGRVDLPPNVPLSSTEVNISFILIDPSTNLPLSAAEALAILKQSNALTRLQTTSYRAKRFSAAVVDEESSSPSNKLGQIAGTVIGALLSVITVVVIVVIIVCVVRWRRSDKINTSENGVGFQGHPHQNRNGTLNSVTFSNQYSQMNKNTSSAEDTQSHESQTIFDDPVYGAGFEVSSNSYRPPVTKKKSTSLERGMRSSLERGMKVMRNKVTSIHRNDPASAESLLRSSPLEDNEDYDDIVIPSATPPLPPRPSTHGLDAEDDSEIYANLQHQRTGAMGNAGERWQSYWQTKTLFRTNAPDPDPTNK